MKFATAVALCAIATVSAEPTRLRLFHRLFHPIAGPTPYSERGTLIIDEQNAAASFQFSTSFRDDMATFGHALRTVGQAPHLALYQVALERSTDKTEADWDISSVKACHLQKASSELITLHAVDLHTLKPYAIDYFVGPIPHDGACRKPRPQSVDYDNAAYAFANNHDRLNTTVVIQASNAPPSPQLVVPPPLSTEGQPIAPLPEKTIIEKYWMYIVGFCLLTLLLGGSEEEKPKK